MRMERRLHYLLSIILSIILLIILQNLYGLKIGGNHVSHHPVDASYKENDEEYRYYSRWYTGPKTKDNPDNHAGVDIVEKEKGKIEGANVYAVEDGEVIYAAEGKKGTGYGGYGNVVAIKHDNGYITLYAHLGDIKTKKGKKVNAGDVIGTVGNTGKSTGPHLHYELRNKDNINKDNPHGQVNPGDASSENYIERKNGEDTGGGDDSWDGGGGRKEDGGDGLPPGGEHPDDNESSATGNPSSYASASKATFYRLAAKKGKANVLLYWNYERLLEERAEYFESLGTGSTPDEYFLNILNTKINETFGLLSSNSLQFAKERSETPDVVILRHGYFGSASSLINLYKEAWRRVPPSFSPLWVKENPVMIIPTGGLYGMENSGIFKAVLEEYVRNGGTIIAFTQQHGYEFSVLPTPDGRPIGAYGWREDQSCSANSIYIDTWHPALASTTRTLIGNPVDGYFDGYPSDSTVLLRRRVNGMPALLSYPYGEGWVVVTSLFTDWVAFPQDKKIIRNLIAWAKNPDLEIPEYNLRDNLDPEVAFDLEVKNTSGETASKVKILWLDPDRNLYFEEEKLVSISAGGEMIVPVSRSFSGIPDSKLGIWHADYILYDSEGDEIQPQAETDSGRFAFSRPPTEIFEVADLTAHVTVSDEDVCWGTQVNFKAHITNKSAKEKRLHLWWDLRHHESEYWDEVVIPADGALTKEITVDFSRKELGGIENFWLHIFEENGEGIYSSLRRVLIKLSGGESWTYVGSTDKGVRVFKPYVYIEVQPEKKHYGRGEAVNTVITLKNSYHPWDPMIHIIVKDSSNAIIYEDSFLRHLESLETVEQNVSFSLPSDAKLGRYFVSVEYLLPTQKKINQSYTHFSVVAPQLKSETAIPSIFQPNSSNPVSFALLNTGLVGVSDGYLDVKLSDPEDQFIFQEQQNFSLPPGQSTNLNFEILLSDIKFGDYKLTYTVFDGVNIGRPIEKAIPSYAHLNVAFDKDSYRMRDEMTIDSSVMNYGEFKESLTLNLKIPSFEYEETMNLTLNPGQKQDLSFTTEVPINIGSGLHPVEVTLTLPSGSDIKRTFQFTVPQSSLAVIPPVETEYGAGEDFIFQTSNSGGVDTAFEYSVSLGDHKSTVFDARGQGVVQAGGTAAISFTIPDQALDGEYLVKIEAVENISQQKSQVKKSIQVSGIKADLEVKTDKDIYLPADDISALSKAVNLDGEIQEANLHLQVVSRELQKTEKWELYNNPFIYRVEAVFEDEGNNIWIGTMGGGVVKYDGDNWKSYGSSSGATDYVSSTGEDNEGNIWIGSDDHYVYKFDGNTWTEYFLPIEDVISDELPVKSILKGSGNLVWFATSGQGAYKFDGANWTNYNTENSGIADDHVSSIAIDREGNLWFGTEGYGVSKFDGTNWTTYTTTDGLASNRVYAITKDHDDNLWFGTNAGVSKYDGSNWDTFNTSNSELAGDYVYAIAEGQEGSLWFGTNGGVSIFNGTEWITYDISNSGLPANDIRSILITQEGMAWFIAKEGWYINITYKLCRYDGTDWTVYESTDVNLKSNDIRKIFIDDQNVRWLGTFRGGVSKFDGSEWITYTTSNSGLAEDWVISAGKDNAGSLWFGTNSRGVSKFDGTDWTTFDTSNSSIPSNSILAIAIDKEGNVWLGTSSGACRYDGTNWTTYTTSDGLAGNYVYAITKDHEGDLWFGTNGGASKFNGADWTTYNTYNSGLPSNFVYAATEDHEGNLWFGTGYGAGKFNGANWTTYNTITSGLVSNYVFAAVADQEGNLWFGTNSGVSKFDGTNWTTYRAYESGLAWNDVRSIAVDQQGKIWFATRYGASVLSGGMQMGAPLWKKDIVINQGANETQELTTGIGVLGRTGKFFLEGRLTSSTGQAISKAEYPFYVAESDTVLMFSPDKAIYRLGETISIQGEVKNLAPAEASDLTLTIQKQSAEPEGEPEEVYTETFNIPAGESHAFSFTVPSTEEGTNILAGIVTQDTEEVANASELYQVSNPHIKATVTAPEVAGLNPFDIGIELENTGLIDGTVTVDIQPTGFSQEVMAKAGDKTPVIAAQQITQTTAFEINITGDHEEAVTKNVLFGLAAGISVTPQSSYPEGRIEIPVKVTNTGPLENEVGIDFTLSLNSTQTGQLTKSYYLPFSQFVEDTLAFDLNPGTYTLSWSSFYGSAQASFEVKPQENMGMAASLGEQTEGIIPLNVSLSNEGYDDFSGSISVESDIYSALQGVALDSGSSNVFTFSIDPNGTAEGEYSLPVKLLRLDNTTVREQTVPVIVTKPRIGVVSVPTGQSFSVGAEASFPFTLSNTGSKEGRAVFKVEVMDMESEEELYLGAGQEEELSFTFLVPHDLPARDYTGKYTLSQEGTLLPLQGEFRFNVQGIDIGVEAELDKSSYTEGETAVLTLSVSNNTQTAVDLFAKVNYRDYEGEQSFTLETSSSLDFSIPLPEITEEKVFYGIYHQDGRGIHLNDIYIYRREEGIEVITDKQVYDPGEAVNILINSTKTGLMRVEAPEYEDEFPVEGSTSRSFTLPSDLLGGTYGLSWSFFPADESGILSGVHLFDVAGLKVVVTEASLDRSRYSPGDTIQARVVFESNQDVSAQLNFWIISPEGGYSDAGSKPVSLSSAEHTAVTESLAFDSSHAGMHRLLYALYTLDERPVVSGSEAFDCGGGVVLGVSTEKRDYPLAAEEVKTYVNLFGDGEAPLTLFINDIPVKTVTVTLSGVTTEEIVLEPALLNPGTQILRAELVKDNLASSRETSFAYGSTLPDITVSSLDYESENLIYTVRAVVLNQGLSPSSATSIAFYEGDPDEGGVLIREAGIGALDSGASAEVEVEWSGQGKSGDREIHAVVDRANAVKEFNEENNRAYLSLSITELFHELRLDKLTFSANEDLNVVTFLINNKDTAIQGQLALKITNLSSATDVWAHSEAVAPIEPLAQSVISNIYNLGPNPEGEYRITQTLTLAGKEIVDEEIITVLKTEKVAGTFTLEPAEIRPNQDEEVLVSVELQNRGNVGIEGGTLNLEVEKKETGLKVDEKLIEFDLDISESKDIQETVTLNLDAGFYTVKLVFNEEVLDEQELEAKFQVIHTKEESLVPRVLILTDLKEKIPGGSAEPEDKKEKDWIYYAQLSLIKQALEEAGVYYKIERKAKEQISEFRSGTYNIIMLLDDSKQLSHIEEEIKERVWRGEGVIGVLTDCDSWKKDFIKEIFGTEVKGKKPKEKRETVETYATAVSAEGEFTLKSSFVELKPKAEELIIVAKIDKGKKPAMTLYHYGEGRTVASGFVLAALPGEPAHEALKQILLNSFAYLKPREEKDTTISRIVPVEMTFRNPSASAITLRIEEEIPAEVKLICAEPELEDEDVLTWEFTLEPSDSIYLRYEVELPDLRGEYAFQTSIIKVEGESELLMDTSVLSYSVEQTVREFILETITEVEKLPITSAHDMGRVRKVVERLSKILDRDETKHSTWKKNLEDTLKALEELEKIESANPYSIRKSLVDLMYYYERRTAEAEKKMNLIFTLDLEKLLMIK